MSDELTVATTAAPPCAPLQVSGVSKRYGKAQAVADLSFALEAGTITGFLGPNGAGKTTTLRMIGGLVRPSQGSLTLFGIDSRQPPARRRLGYMPADPAFLPHLTGTQNLDLLLQLRGAALATDRTIAASALELSEAVLDRQVGGYSSGMRQKLAIVAAVQHRPDLVVLDEPANRLDPLAHHAFCTLIRAIAEGGRTVLLSSHVLAEVEEACDGVILIRDGVLLRQARVDALQQEASRAVTITYSTPPMQLPNVLVGARQEGNVVTGRIPARRPDLVRDLVSAPGVVDFSVSVASLEEIFLDLYRRVSS